MHASFCGNEAGALSTRYDRGLPGYVGCPVALATDSCFGVLGGSESMVGAQPGTYDASARESNNRSLAAEV